MKVTATRDKTNPNAGEAPMAAAPPVIVGTSHQLMSQNDKNPAR